MSALAIFGSHGCTAAGSVAAGLGIPQDAFDFGENLLVVEVRPGDAPAGQAATHVPQPLHKAVITRLTFFSSSYSMAL